MKQLLLTALSLLLLYVGLGTAAAGIKFAIKTGIFLAKKILSK